MPFPNGGSPAMSSKSVEPSRYTSLSFVARFPFRISGEACARVAVMTPVLV